MAQIDIIQKLSAEKPEWSTKGAEYFREGIKVAFFHEAVRLAQNLAEEGHQLHPDDPYLAKADRLLNPMGRVTRTDRPPKPHQQQSIAWLKQNWETYYGQFVALDKDTLLGVGDSYEELIERLGIDPEAPEIMVTMVARYG